jgi:hypothetical protein
MDRTRSRFSGPGAASHWLQDWLVLMDSSDERVCDLEIFDSLVHRKDKMLYKIVKLLSFSMSDMFCIFQKLWNSFDLNESGHVSLSETQRVSSEFRLQTSDFTAQIQIQSPEKSESRSPELTGPCIKEGT